MKKSSLKVKLLTWFGSITFVILLIFSLFFYYFLNNSINANIQTQLDSKAHDIEEEWKTKEYSKDITFAVYDTNLRLIEKSSSFNVSGVENYLKQKNSFFILNNQELDEEINALYIYKSKTKTIVIYENGIDNKIEDVVSTLLILDPLLLLVLIVLASKIIDKILVPVKNVIAISKNISVNDFATMIELPKEHDEIWELVDSFNEMRMRLQSGVQSIEQFNSDVSHELKTPLTVILGEIEVTLRRMRSSEEYIKSMQSVHDEAKQMQKIVENMLLLTKFTKANIQQTFEKSNLTLLLQQVIAKFENKADQKQIKIHMDRIDEVILEVNPTLLALIFSNLIDNAVKYSKADTTVSISLFQEDNKLHLLVEDEGIGIEREHLDKISDRFYRVDSSRNKKIEGFGLGLFIVKHILDLHDGAMQIFSEPDKGTTFHIVL